MNFVKTSIAAVAISLAATSAMAEGMYAKVGLGYGMNFKNKNYEIAGGKTKRKGVAYEVAVGFNADKNLSVDFSFSTNPKYQTSKYANANNNAKEVLKSQLYMVNATYYGDFGYSVRPFVTAGLGLGHATRSVNKVVLSKASTVKTSKIGLAKMIGVGLEMPINSNVSADLTYKISTPGVAVKETYNDKKGKTVWNQAIIAGVKVNF